MVNLPSAVFEAGAQQPSLPPQLPFFLWVIAEDGEGKIPIDGDLRRDRLEIAFEELNAFAER